MRNRFQHQGRQISYLEASGTSSTPGGGTIVFLHAFPLAAEMWEPQLRDLPPGWRALAPDLRGFGESAPSTQSGPSMDDYAEDVLALLDHAKVETAVIVGLSMGGYAAFALLRKAEHRVRGLVLADTRPEADTPQARAGREEMLQTLARDGVTGVVEKMLPRLLGRTSLATRPEVVERVRALAGLQSADAIADAIQRLMHRPDSTPLLAAVDVPTLIVVGAEDEITPEDIARAMHGQIAQSELAVIGHAGHLSNLEQPDAFNVALARFLAVVRAA